MGSLGSGRKARGIGAEFAQVLTRGRRASAELVTVISMKTRRRRGGVFLGKNLGSRRKTGGIRAEFVQVSTRGRRASDEFVVVVSMKRRRRTGGVFLVENSGIGRKTGTKVCRVRGSGRELLGDGNRGRRQGQARREVILWEAAVVVALVSR